MSRPIVPPVQIQARDLFGKRVLDVLGSGLLIVMLSVPMALIAVLVKLGSSGPVLYKARRVGRGGVEFRQLKFRSMVDGCSDLRNPDGSTVADDGDRRITPVGRFIRRWSLDELPQLVNVLRGDMSLVGPRPDPPDALAHYRPQDFARLAVRPGLTGWAALHGRNTLPWERRRDLDIEYVATPSLWLDLRIILCTPLLVLRGTGINAPRKSEAVLQ